MTAFPKTGHIDGSKSGRFTVYKLPVAVILALLIRANFRKSVVDNVAVVIKEAASVHEITALVTHKIGRDRFVLDAFQFVELSLQEVAPIGGADTDDVYTFAWLHYGVLDISYRF